MFFIDGSQPDMLFKGVYSRSLIWSAFLLLIYFLIYLCMAKQKRTYFTKSDLVSFGNYVLSEVREKMYKELPSNTPYESRFRNVSDADLANWKEIKSE